MKRLKRTKSLSSFFKSWRGWLLARTQSKLPEGNILIEDENLILSTALAKNESVTLTLHQLTNDSYFARQTITYANNATGETLKLELFTNECRIRAAH